MSIIMPREVIPFALTTEGDVPFLQAVGDSLGFTSTNWQPDQVVRYAGESRDSILGNLSSEERHYILTIFSGANETAIPIACSRLFETHGHTTQPHHAWHVDGDALNMEIIDDSRFAEVGAMIVHRAMQATETGESDAVDINGHNIRRLKGYGKVGSYARFLLAALVRERFAGRACLSEFLPHLENGTNTFYETLIREHFRGMSYADADTLTMKDAEHLQKLPRTLGIPPSLRDQVGKVGPKSARAAKNLKALGFQYTERIDPLDAGPHWTGPFNTNPIFAGAINTRFDGIETPFIEAGWEYGLLGILDTSHARPFRGCATPYLRDGTGVRLPPDAVQFLQLDVGMQVTVAPYGVSP